MSMRGRRREGAEDPLNETLRERARMVADVLSGRHSTTSASRARTSRRSAATRWPKLVEDKREMIITERGNVLFVEEHGGVFWDGSAGLGRARSQGLGGEIICRLQFDNLHMGEPGQDETADDDDPDLDPPSRLLRTADRFLIGGREPGLRAWDHETGGLGDRTTPVKKGKILLFIPGMFINGETLIEQIPKGSGDLLDRAARRYDQILVFDHFSLSDSPLLSAVKIGGLFRNSKADIDIVCHGRGSLIARWWLQGLPSCATGRRRTVLIAPDMGNRLFAPYRLRSTLNLLINLARVQDSEETSSALLAVAMAVFVVVSSVSSLDARPPIVRSALASIPGIAPPCSNLHHLRQDENKSFPVCCVITSDFEPDNQDRVYWPFWHYLLDRHFRFERSDSINAFDEPIISRQNDLISQDERYTNEICRYCEILHQFQPENYVHHFNYFSRSATCKMIMNALKID